MSVFDKTIEKCEVFETIDNELKSIKYEKHYYPYFKQTYCVLKCPKYLHSALKCRFDKYEVSVCDDDHINVNENGIIEVYKEIYKAKQLLNKYHKGHTIYKMEYNQHNEWDLVYIQNESGWATFMVSHTKKNVSGIHGYCEHGKVYAKNIGYTHNGKIID